MFSMLSLLLLCHCHFYCFTAAVFSLSLPMLLLLHIVFYYCCMGVIVIIMIGVRVVVSSIIIALIKLLIVTNTVKPLNSGHLRVLKNLSVRCPLLGGKLKKIVTFSLNVLSAIHWHVLYWGVSLYCIIALSFFTVFRFD